MRTILRAAIAAAIVLPTFALPALSAGRSDEACFRTASVSGYQVIDDTHLVVQAPTKSRTYLLTLDRRCSDLSWSNKAALSSFGARACSGDFAKVVAARNTIGRVPDMCRIKTVERVDSFEAAKALVATRAIADRDVRD